MEGDKGKVHAEATVSERVSEWRVHWCDFTSAANYPPHRPHRKQCRPPAGLFLGTRARTCSAVASHGVLELRMGQRLICFKEKFIHDDNANHFATMKHLLSSLQGSHQEKKGLSSAWIRRFLKLIFLSFLWSKSFQWSLMSVKSSEISQLQLTRRV